jgi:hypothetical protein
MKLGFLGCQWVVAVDNTILETLEMLDSRYANKKIYRT